MARLFPKRTATDPSTAPEPSPLLELQREIDRSRRHGHRFVLARCAPAGSDPRGLIDALTASLRRTDRWWLEGGVAFVLAPESTPARVGTLVDRLRDSLPGPVVVDVVAFPDDGLTARALLAALRHGARTPPRLGPTADGAEKAHGAGPQSIASPVPVTRHNGHERRNPIIGSW